MRNKYKEVSDLMDNFQNLKITIKPGYSGRGRPKKSDYIKCKIKDEIDIRLMFLFKNAFTTSYARPDILRTDKKRIQC